MNKDITLEFKENIIEMVKSLHNEDYLMKIYYFVKVKYNKEKENE